MAEAHEDTPKINEEMQRIKLCMIPYNLDILLYILLTVRELEIARTPGSFFVILDLPKSFVEARLPRWERLVAFWRM